MQFRVRFYFDADGNKPLIAFLEDLRKQERILHKLVVAGIKKLETIERHDLPLTALVDQKDALFELRIGDKNIARVFFFFDQARKLLSPMDMSRNNRRSIQESCNKLVLIKKIGRSGSYE